MADLPVEKVVVAVDAVAVDGKQDRDAVPGPGGDLREVPAGVPNLPPSYVLIHRVSTAGTGVLCQLECERPFRAEVVRWGPGYADPAAAA